MREHYSLDRLIEYGTEPIPDAISLVNPQWRKLDSQIRSQPGKRHTLAAQFGALALSEDPSESELHRFEQRKGELREEIQALGLEIDKLKAIRKNTPHHVAVSSLPDEDRFTRLRTERKHFIDTLKMIAYRAESSMASLLREHLARGDDDGPRTVAPGLSYRHGYHARPVRQHSHSPAPPSHASRSRSGHRETTRRPQSNADRFSWYSAHPGLQTRLSLTSPGSGGLTVAVATPIIIGVLSAPAVRAQDATDWQTKAGGKMSFEVASVKLSKPDAIRTANFVLDPSDSFQDMRTNERPNGRFSANSPLSSYVRFAYKLHLSTPAQLNDMISHLPKWVSTDVFEIQARAPGNPTKDQMRLMVQALLAERFQLAVHFETHETPVLAMTLAKPGKTGPGLRPHAEGPSCDAPPSPNMYPPVCGIMGWKFGADTRGSSSPLLLPRTGGGRDTRRP
jgi:hypothetical protein